MYHTSILFLKKPISVDYNVTTYEGEPPIWEDIEIISVWYQDVEISWILTTDGLDDISKAIFNDRDDDYV